MSLTPTTLAKVDIVLVGTTGAPLSRASVTMMPGAGRAWHDKHGCSSAT